MKKAIIFNGEKKSTVTGNLVAVNPVATDKATGFIMVIGNGDHNYFKVGFFDSEKANYSDRLAKSNAEKSIGKPITVVYQEKGDLNLGLAWEYPNSLITLNDKQSIYFSRIGKVKTGSLGQAVLSLAVRKGKETEWYTVCFFNNEKYAWADNILENYKAGDLVLIKGAAPKTLDNGLQTANGYFITKIQSK